MSAEDTEAAFNEEDLREFTRLVELGESCRQLDRIESRLQFPKFIKQHGKAKCDAMFLKLIGKEKP